MLYCSNTSQISSLNVQQKTELRKIVEERKDVFFNLPACFGKSLLSQASPLMFDLTSQEPGHVISPLISLMEDQVSHLKELGLKAANISSLEVGECTHVKSSEYSLVYGSPEAWLKNDCDLCWQTLYIPKNCAIAVNEVQVVRQWQVFKSKWYEPLNLENGWFQNSDNFDATDLRF